MSPQRPNLTQQCSGLCLLLTVYASLFAVAGILLLQIRTYKNVTSHKSTNYDYPWAADEFDKLNHTREADGLQWPYNSQETIGCVSLRELTNLEFVAAGWTKAVYKGNYKGRDVAVKTVNLNGRDMRQCDESMSACYRRASAKILKEMLLLTELAHRNVIKVLGSCVPETTGPVAIVTELGQPIDTVKLLQFSWEDRLRLALGIAQVLNHLSHSPLGSLSMNDFRRQQFVLVDGTLKLSDVDDLGIGEPECQTDKDCTIDLQVVGNKSRQIQLGCVDGSCHGFNERLNVWRAGQHFVRLFLPLSAPASLEPHVRDLLFAYEQPGLWDTATILTATQQLVHRYAAGDYFSSEVISVSSLGFEKISDSDLPGEFDYPCHQSMSAVVCIMSVLNEVEAAETCAKDADCKAVVLGQEQTWTGRTLAIFKNGYSLPSARKGFSLLVKKDAS